MRQRAIHHSSAAFSLIEILIVVTIISLLVSVAAFSYSQFVKQSRDAKRKTDIEQIRASIEMYKSFNNVYPTPDTVSPNNGMPFGTGSITDASGATYISKLPTDPKSAGGLTYYYTTTSDYLDYTICAHLESSGTTTASSCGTSTSCNYCMGPYGEK